MEFSMLARKIRSCCSVFEKNTAVELVATWVQQHGGGAFGCTHRASQWHLVTLVSRQLLAGSDKDFPNFALASLAGRLEHVRSPSATGGGSILP